MNTMSTVINIDTTPHIKTDLSSDVIMKNVVFAIIPIAVFGIYVFGLSALFVIAVATLSCVGTEYVLCILSNKKSTINDWSAVITGILLGLTLPPGFPLWMTFLGGVISIFLGKYLFGGLGFNIFNPALVGRAFLQAAFPVAITTWNPVLDSGRFTSVASSSFTLPFLQPLYDGATGATPLGLMKFDHITTGTMNLFMGFTSGSIGETSIPVIIICGIYLAYKKMLDWKIPLSICLTAFLFSGLFFIIDPGNYPSPFFVLMSGGLALGAVFMATDMVGSPVTAKGTWIYGCFIGFLIVVIRFWGGLPEGVMYCILLGNALTPLINRFTQPHVFGSQTTNKK